MNNGTNLAVLTGTCKKIICVVLLVILAVIILLSINLIRQSIPWIFMDKIVNGATDETFLVYGNNLYCYSRTLITEDGWGSSSINVSKFRSNAVITVADGKQIMAYFDGNGIATIALLENGTVYEVKIRDTMKQSLLGDGHCSINIGYSDSYIYYAYGAHNTEFYFGRILVEDLYSEKHVAATEINHLITYPAFYSVGNSLWFVFRDDENGTGWSYIDLTGKSELNFEEMVNIVGGKEVYINDIAVSSNGQYLAIPFVERLATDEQTKRVRNEGIYLMWSSDGGDTWNYSQEEGSPLPVELSESEKVIDIGADENLTNQESTYVTDDGEVLFTRITDDENGIPQLYLTTFDTKDRSCESYCVSVNEEDFDLIGAGTLTLPVSRGEIAVSDDFVHVIYRQNESIVIASAVRNGDTMNFDRLIIEDAAGETWEPNYDKVLWETEKTLSLFVQKTYQEESDKLGSEEINTPIYLYWFKEIE